MLGPPRALTVTRFSAKEGTMDDRYAGSLTIEIKYCVV